MSLHSDECKYQSIIISHSLLLRGLNVLDKFSFEFWKPKTKVIILGSHMIPIKILANECERHQTYE